MLKKKPTISREQLELALKDYKGPVQHLPKRTARVYGTLNRTTAGKG